MGTEGLLGGRGPVLPSPPLSGTRLRRAGLLAAAAVAIGLVAAACSSNGDGTADLPGDVVVQVGDAEITDAELGRGVAQQRAQAQQQGTSFPEEGSDGFDAVRRQALDTLVLQRVIDFESRRCGEPCRVTPEEVDQELERIKRQQFNGSDQQLNQFLRRASITRADARRLLRSQLQQPKLFNRITRGVRFGPVEARRFYNDNGDQFRVPAGRTAAHILVETEAEAIALRERVTTENFARLARESSTDTGSAAQGGDLGPIRRGQLVDPFEEVAFALADGEISEPVKTQFGWHIITAQVTPASATPFAEARDPIISQQLSQKRQEEFATWRDEVLAEWEDRALYADAALRPERAPQPQPVPSPPEPGAGQP